MNATEDGREASDAGPPRPGLRAGFQWLALAGLLIGPLLGAVVGPFLVPDRPLFETRVRWEGAVPTLDHWSHPPGPGESATLATAGAEPTLVALARTPAAAEALAIELTMARLSRSPELAGRRAAGRAAWSEAMLRGPAATLSSAARCAALLRGWSMAWSAVVGPAQPAASGESGGPAGGAGATAGGAASGSARVEAPGARRAGASGAAAAIPPMPEIARLALAWDAVALEDALRREARVARGMLFARIGAQREARRAAGAESWRGAWSARAAELDTIAGTLEARLSRIERELVAGAAPAYALDAEPAIPDPGVIALLSASLPPVAARPLFRTWGAFAAVGAILACLIAVPLAWVAARARAARRAALMRQLQSETAAALAATPWTPSATVEARLQVVSGPRPRRVARVVRELVAHFLTGGERVLVVDAGRSFRLHDSFGGRARLGFQECMREQLPLLGVVQRGGLPGLFVLAHGSASRLESWMPLRRLLEQARPHFSRVVLALEPNVPRQAGEALAGRLIDGWWAAPDVRKARGARRFSTRLGIPLRSFELDSPDDAAVETLVQRMTAAAHATAVVTAVGPATAVAPEPAPGVVAAHAAAVVTATAPATAVAAEPAPAEVMADAATDAKLEPARAVALTAADATPEPAPTVAHAAAEVTPEPHAEPVPPAATAHEPEGEPVTAYEQEESALAIPEFGDAAAVAAAAGPEEPVASEAAADSVPESGTPPTLAATLALMSAPDATSTPEPPGLAPAPAYEEAPTHAFSPEPPGLAPAPVYEEAHAPVPEPDAAPAAPAVAGDAIVLDCDPEVSDRLRFLVWMRRLRAKKSRGEAVHAP